MEYVLGVECWISTHGTTSKQPFSFNANVLHAHIHILTTYYKYKGFTEDILFGFIFIVMAFDAFAYHSISSYHFIPLRNGSFDKGPFVSVYISFWLDNPHFQTHIASMVALYEDALLLFFKNAYVFLSHLWNERFAWNPLKPLIGHENESINPKQINILRISSKIQKLFFGVGWRHSLCIPTTFVATKNGKITWNRSKRAMNEPMNVHIYPENLWPNHSYAELDLLFWIYTVQSSWFFVQYEIQNQKQQFQIDINCEIGYLNIGVPCEPFIFVLLAIYFPILMRRFYYCCCFLLANTYFQWVN